MFTRKPQLGLTILTLCLVCACFRPAPPLEEGDGIEPEYSVETDTDERVTVKGHPVVLKRGRAKISVKTKPETPQIPVTNAHIPTASPPLSTQKQTPEPTPIPAGLNLATVIGLSPTISGICDPAALAFNATTTSGRVIRTTCESSGVLRIVIHLPAGSDNFTVQFTQTYGDGSTSSKATTYERDPFICPEGYVGVPASHTEGLGHTQATAEHSNWWLDVAKDFCVMKYPAKNNNSSTYATSTMTNTPWTSIKRGIDESDPASAFKACNDVPNGTYRLISNTQWQTIARNAESVGDNWSGGSTGSGSMNKGHSDGPCCTKANSSDDDPYFGTGNTADEPVGSGWEQRRTHVLSNGEIVWDMGGNVQQWIADEAGSLGMSPEIFAFTSFKNPTYFSHELHSTNRLLFAPHGNFDHIEDVGHVIGGSQQTMTRSLFWNISSVVDAGIFTISFFNSAASSLTGFRCTYIP